MIRFIVACLGFAAVAASSNQAFAFTHIVNPGETLAQIADRLYGYAKLESVLVGANALDVQGGTVIVPGMRLEVPAPGHHTALQGETWADLALSWLGAKDIARADVLARANKGVPWVPPIEGQEIEIPAVVTYLAGEGDTVNTIAYRFWGDPNLGWELNPYNHRDGVLVKRGEVVLVPMMHLRLTDAGKTEARIAAERDGGAAATAVDQQRRADADLPQLLADVRFGRYAEAVARGNRILGGGVLTRPQLATVHRALPDAYVTMDANAAAAAACVAGRFNWRNAVPDPMPVSPKILSVCAEH